MIGNVYQGIECLRRALHYAPPSYQDVPLLNLANMLYRWKNKDVEDAYNLIKRAIAINSLEVYPAFMYVCYNSSADVASLWIFQPELHFFMGSMCAEKGNLTGAMWHYEETLLQQRDHSEALDMLEKIKCHYKFYRHTQSAAPKKDAVTCSKPATPQKADSFTCARVSVASLLIKVVALN